MITLNTENKVSTKIRLEDLYNSDREKIAEQVVRFNNISNTFLKIFNKIFYIIHYNNSSEF